MAVMPTHDASAARVVLASTSPYRRALLERLELPFAVVAPDCDESPRAGEPGEALVRRLAEAKARAVAPACPDKLVIGSDQVGLCNGRILTKPGDHNGALAQLRALSGRTVRFFTGLCLLNTANGNCHLAVETYTVKLRDLTDAEIESYVVKDRPYDCAGAFKAEGLGIALFASMAGSDPTTLIGLPLIRLSSFLTAEGCSPLG